MSNVGLNPEIPILDETTRLSVLKNGQFAAMLTDFASIKPNRRMMVTQKLMGEDSGLNCSSDEEEREKNLPISEEIYKKLIVNVEHPTQKEWETFDLKCFIKLGIDMYHESGMSPGEARDINVALDDFNDLILNEEDRPISIEHLSKHLLLMTDKESHDLVYNTLSALGYKDWENSYTDIQVKKIDKAGDYLLEKIYLNDWRQCFPMSIKHIKPGFQNQFAFRGNDYRRFMSFAYILAKHHADCQQLKGALHTHFKVTNRPIDSPEKATQFLIHRVPRLRKFCVLVQNIISIP